MANDKASQCPGCGKTPEPKFAPFCSAGCKDRDLLQWLGEGYKVPGPPVSPDQLADHLARSTSSKSDG